MQLTGRDNYLRHGRAIGLEDQLIANPELANDPDIAARLLASFLKGRETPILAALAKNDLAAARKLVNGGRAGIARFVDAYQRGQALIP